MIIYNVTINIDESIHDDWLLWMTNTHIPEVMKSKMFLAAKMSKVIVTEPLGGITYSIQYSCENQTKLDQYQKQFEEKIETKHKEKFQNKFVAFPSLLKIVKEF